ncbi:MAG: MBL fold metallo-hydrolase [Anaerolineae bacterium]|nr:MBL fold metallo-hydrolase [Anaerolineae bacterium]
MHTILPRLSTFTGLVMGRVYLVEDPDGLTIIDTGLELAAARVLKQLEQAGRKPGDVKRILVTHGHPDHIGGLPELKARTGAQVVAHALDRAAIEGRTPVPRVPADQLKGMARMMRPGETTLKGTPVDHVVDEGEVLPVLGGLHVLFTPGHSPGHVAYWQPDQKVVFCGDVIMRLPNLRPPIAAFTVDMAENQRSLKRLVDLAPRVVCFGHGQPLTDDTAERLRAYARKVGAM